MSLSIQSDQAARLAAELMQVTGETITEAVIRSLEERLARLRLREVSTEDLAAIRQISRHCASLPDLDTRPAEEILGYDERGMF